MPYQQNKIIVFTIGLLAGMIICFGIFFVFLNKTENSNAGKILTTDTDSEAISYDNKAKSKLKTDYKPSDYKIPKTKKENISNPESVPEDFENDSMMFDSLENDEIGYSVSQTNDGLIGNEDVVIMKDEMIYVRNIKPTGEIIQEPTGQNIDSLLVDNDINNEEILSYRVEFWKSPVNYIGYKMDNDKIVLFGIYEYTKAKLRFINNILFLDYLDKVYELEENSGFEPLVPLQSKDF